MDSTYPMPLNRRVKKLIDGLTYQAVKSGSNWMLPLGKDAAAGEYITVDGVLGHATSAIVGGTDTIVEDTNWVPECDGGALNALNSKITLKSIETISMTFSGGLCNVNKSSYPTIKHIIPFGYSYGTEVRIGISRDTETYWQFVAQPWNSNAWYDGTKDVQCFMFG